MVRLCSAPPREHPFLHFANKFTTCVFDQGAGASTPGANGNGGSASPRLHQRTSPRARRRTAREHFESVKSPRLKQRLQASMNVDEVDVDAARANNTQNCRTASCGVVACFPVFLHAMRV